MNFSRRTKVIVFSVAAVFGGYFLLKLVGGSGGVPEEFSSARLQGALIAQNIVDLSNKSAKDLEVINELDRKRKFTEALTLTADAITKSREIRDKAIDLSREVEKMTVALSDISSFDARQAALESISSRLALISRLINYSGYLSQLLEALQERFVGAQTGNVRIAALLEQINSEVRAINNFNNQATASMERFDQLIAR